jgi:hypothetical protein
MATKDLEEKVSSQPKITPPRFRDWEGVKKAFRIKDESDPKPFAVTRIFTIEDKLNKKSFTVFVSEMPPGPGLVPPPQLRKITVQEGAMAWRNSKEFRDYLIKIGGVRAGDVVARPTYRHHEILEDGTLEPISASEYETIPTERKVLLYQVNGPSAMRVIGSENNGGLKLCVDARRPNRFPTAYVATENQG